MRAKISLPVATALPAKLVAAVRKARHMQTTLVLLDGPSALGTLHVQRRHQDGECVVVHPLIVSPNRLPAPEKRTREGKVAAAGSTGETRRPPGPQHATTHAVRVCLRTSGTTDASGRGQRRGAHEPSHPHSPHVPAVRPSSRSRMRLHAEGPLQCFIAPFPRYAQEATADLVLLVGCAPCCILHDINTDHTVPSVIAPAKF